MLNRKFEHPSADLEERIIASSFYVRQKKSPQQKISGLFDSLKKTFAEFSLPNPAYIMPVVFILGVLVSFSFSSSTAAADLTQAVDEIYFDF